MTVLKKWITKAKATHSFTYMQVTVFTFFIFILITIVFLIRKGAQIVDLRILELIRLLTSFNNKKLMITWELPKNHEMSVINMNKHLIGIIVLHLKLWQIFLFVYSPYTFEQGKITLMIFFLLKGVGKFGIIGAKDLIHGDLDCHYVYGKISFSRLCIFFSSGFTL